MLYLICDAAAFLCVTIFLHLSIYFYKSVENRLCFWYTYYNENEKDSQMMLLPDIITLNHKQMDIARDNMMLFKKAGFEVLKMDCLKLIIFSLNNLLLQK